MDPIRNPFAPGAGCRPPELSGRANILEPADISLKRVLHGRHAKSQILQGLRGVGKTVLLKEIEKKARNAGYKTSFIEAPEDKSLPQLLYPKFYQVLRQFSFAENAKKKGFEAMQALRSFAGVFKISVGDMSLSVDAAPGTADSGMLEYDMSDMFAKVGEAAKAADSGWALFIDEVQYLSDEELCALIVAIHHTNQENLPVIFFGAGLPQVAALMGDAKSYAERLFDFPGVAELDKEAALRAIAEPIEGEGESIDPEALEAIYDATYGYPFFLQEWGFQAWSIAEQSPVTAADVTAATPRALQRLDESFFKVRFDRLTPKERDYVFAMAALGKGPYRSADVADVMSENPKKLGPFRAQIIKKGMIYSPSHGDIAFTVPMFEEYLNRIKNAPAASAG